MRSFQRSVPRKSSVAVPSDETPLRSGAEPEGAADGGGVIGPVETLAGAGEDGGEGGWPAFAGGDAEGPAEMGPDGGRPEAAGVGTELVPGLDGFDPGGGAESELAGGVVASPKPDGESADPEPVAADSEVDSAGAFTLEPSGNGVAG